MKPSQQATPQEEKKKLPSNVSDDIVTKQKEVLPVQGSSVQNNVLEEETKETTIRIKASRSSFTSDDDQATASVEKPSPGGKHSFRTPCSKLSDQQRAFHQELLFGLFLQYNEEEIGRLADRCNSLSLQVALDEARQRNLNQNDRSTPVINGLYMNNFRADNQKINNRKRKRNHCDVSHEEKQKSNPKSDPLTLVPKSLSSAILALNGRVGNGGEQTRNIAPIESAVMKKRKRKDYTSLNMKALEGKILSKFNSSIIGKKAFKTRNPSYSRYFQNKEKITSKNDLSRKSGLNAKEADPNFQTFSLQYNECSLASFAKWALHGEGVRLSPNQITAETSNFGGDNSLQFPAFPTLFHCCQICKKWGHWELECGQIMKSKDPSLSSVAAEIDRERNLKTLEDNGIIDVMGLAQTNGSAKNGQRNHGKLSCIVKTSAICAICRIGSQHIKSPLIPCISCGLVFHEGCIQDTSMINETDNYCYCLKCSPKNIDIDEFNDERHPVDLEGCKGFAIESRTRSSFILKETKSPVINQFEKILSGQSLQRVICIASNKLIASSTQQLPMDYMGRKSKPAGGQKQDKILKNPVLSEGSLCWAKREYAEVGTPGQNEWWPAQVITTSKEESRPAPYEKFTPYVVKFLGVCHARATAVLPFFQHFRRITKNTMSGHSVVNSKQFHKSLAEAMVLMGFNSISELEARADELCKLDMKKKTAAQSNLSHKSQSRFPCNSDDEDAAVYKQDKFVIYARASVAKKSSREKKAKVTARMFSSERLPGSLVAWMRTNGAVGTHVGIVLVVDIERKLALVQEIEDW
eukprot:CAMPEP_0178899608 /NCGR_PEP_ID=MMETSP0786-20121207/3002_1 /TAXON_ID=186022 /ORGANISM="Thalassionema frauenfeldii, Strain CCMP 1798" /LENGTH=806 /DNA_ID=CAMNT_0020570499 /DNA_START=17 /DNA_END=2434 /DNA_ORIENTATION=-